MDGSQRPGLLSFPAVAHLGGWQALCCIFLNDFEFAGAASLVLFF